MSEARNDLSNSNDTPERTLCRQGICKREQGTRFGLRSGSHTEIGPTRDTNDDLVFADDPCRLFIVLDGMGGYSGGAEASRIVLEALRDEVESLCSRSGSFEEHLAEVIASGLRAASSTLLDAAVRHPEHDSMGTVLVLGFIEGEFLHYTQVGDCRIYLIRNGIALQLTHDETFVQTLVDAGEVSKDEAKSHPMRNIVLNSISTRRSAASPKLQRARIRPGDVIVLASDGVTDTVSDQQLIDVASDQPNDPTSMAQQLVDIAYAEGSRDNASCVVVCVGNDLHPQQNEEQDMNEDELRLELAKLHQMLQDVDEVDAKLRNDLLTVANDIDVALTSGNDLGVHHERLSDVALDFKTRHPQLSALTTKIVDMLANFGI